MKRLFNFVWSIFFTIGAMAPLSGEIIESNEINTLRQYVDQNAFVFLNITGTLYEPSTTLSDNQWREYFAQRVKRLISDSAASQQLIDQIKNQIVQKIPKKAVEKITPDLISDLQKKQIVVLGLTKKQMSTTYAENFGWITQNHLAQLGIHLDKTLSYLRYSPQERQKSYSFAYGILFTNKQPEGPAMVSFLKEIQQKPSKIIVVDNGADALKSLEESLKPTQIPFTGIRYGRADALKANFDPTLGTIEFFAFIKEGKILSDAEALEIKKSHPQTNYESLLDQYIQQQPR